MNVRYCIVGGGAAAAAAIEGIRSRDKTGNILMLSRENHRPYRRPLLTKDLLLGTATLDRLPLRPDEWYVEQKVDVRLRHEVIEVDAESRRLWDERGEVIEFGDLLLATGCRPRRLIAEGAEISSVRYFRDLEDYLDLESRLDRVQHITMVGGGFTSVEMAGALRTRGKEITLVVPDEYPLHRLLPRDLGAPLLDYLREMGVETVSGDTLVKIEEANGLVHARTLQGNELDTQLVLVDQGGEPLVDLAAGDVAEYPCLALNAIVRVEGSDHAEQHGRTVGANMAGANEPYTHVPLKWFRVGDLQFEGVGELWARLATEIVWMQPGREGVVFYLREDVIRGVLLINVPERLEWARSLIRDAHPMTSSERAAMVGEKAGA